MRWQRRGFAVGVCGGLASLSGGLLAAELPGANAPRPAGRGRERGAERTAIRAEVEHNAASIATAFENQLDALYAAESMDLSADITVLQNMLKGQGLS